MRALILTYRVPFPPNSGYPIVVYNTIKGLLKLDVEISVFSINPSKYKIDVDDIYDPIHNQINFYSYNIDTEVNIWGALFNIFSNQSYNVSRYYDIDAAKLLANLLKEQEFDIV